MLRDGIEGPPLRLVRNRLDVNAHRFDEAMQEGPVWPHAKIVRCYRTILRSAKLTVGPLSAHYAHHRRLICRRPLSRLGARGPSFGNRPSFSGR